MVTHLPPVCNGANVQGWDLLIGFADKNTVAVIMRMVMVMITGKADKMLE